MSLLFLPSSRLYPPFTPTTWTTPSLFLFLIFFSYLMVLLCFCLPLFYSIFCAPTFSYGPLSPFNHRICLGDLIWFDMNRTPYSETLTCSLTVKFVLSLIPIFYLPPCFLGLLFERNESAYCSCVSFFLYSLGRPSAKVPFFLLFFFQLLYPSSLFFPPSRFICFLSKSITLVPSMTSSTHSSSRAAKLNYVRFEISRSACPYPDSFDWWSFLSSFVLEIRLVQRLNRFFYSFSFSLLSWSLLCLCLVLNHAVRLLHLQCIFIACIYPSVSCIDWGVLHSSNGWLVLLDCVGPDKDLDLDL